MQQAQGRVTGACGWLQANATMLISIPHVRFINTQRVVATGVQGQPGGIQCDCQ